MSRKTEQFRWWRVTLFAWLVGSSCIAWASAAQAVTSVEDPQLHADRSIRRALSLLQAPTPVRIDVIDVRKLTLALGHVVEQTCAYVQKGVSRIYVNSSCPVYQAAGDSLFDAMKLAAILRHEMAHLDGADEARAYLLEAETFRKLLGRAPANLLTPGIAYAFELERRAAALIADTEQQARLPAGGRRASRPQQLRSMANLPSHVTGRR